MNKTELIDSIADRMGVGRTEASKHVEAFLEVIQKAVVSGDSVTITGFGKFAKVERAARIGRNPQTGAAVKIKKSSAPKFTPGSEFKAYVNGTKKLGKPAAAPKAAVKKAPAKKAAAKTTKKAVK